MMFAWLRRRKRSRQDPTAAQAFEQLVEGRCLYAGLTKCSGSLRSVELREDGAGCVLVCRAHYGRLRKLSDRDAAKLERELRKAFSERRGVEHLLATGSAPLDTG
jgi:hypothetical protein